MTRTLKLALREQGLIEAAITATEALNAAMVAKHGVDIEVALEQAQSDLKTFALLYSAQMIRESGEAGTERMAAEVERIADYTESLVVNVRQGDEP